MLAQASFESRIRSYNLSGHHDSDESEHYNVGQFEHFQFFVSENAPNAPSLRQQISAVARLATMKG